MYPIQDSVAEKLKKIYLFENEVLLEFSLESRSLIHSVRGQNGFLNLVLTEKNMQVKCNLILSVY